MRFPSGLAQKRCLRHYFKSLSVADNITEGFPVAFAAFTDEPSKQETPTSVFMSFQEGPYTLLLWN